MVASKTGGIQAHSNSLAKPSALSLHVPFCDTVHCFAHVTNLCKQPWLLLDWFLSQSLLLWCMQAPLKVGTQHVSASITILEDNSMPFLFGLDMLRRYQCSIDLHKNVLRFGSINNAELPFLAEHELPERLRRESGDPPAGKGVGEGSSSGPAILPNSAPGLHLQQ